MQTLGTLEADVMNVLWSVDEAVTVRTVLETLNTDRDLAYTTVMTVLDNLRKKNFVTRSPQGRAFVYHATQSRVEFATETLREVLSSSGDAEKVLLHFAKSANKSESAAIRNAFGRKGSTR